MPDNTISSDLQLTTIFDTAIEEFERYILPLNAFSTVFSNVPLSGDGTITVPYYPMETAESGSRAEGEAYSTKVSATTTQSKQIRPNRNKIQGISFTPEEISRQPQFDPEKHGRRKGQKLAYDVLKDIFSIIRRANFSSGSTLGAVTPSNFDNDDIRALMRHCDDDRWPEMGRSCWLDSELYSEVLGDAAVLDLSQSGTTDPLRAGVLPNLYGFGMGKALGMHSNNEDAVALTSVTHGSDLLTLTGHTLANGDIVRFGGTPPAGLSTGTDYFVINVATNTFQVSATSGGAAVNLTDNGTSPTVQRLERLGGFVAYESAILTAFAPVPPTPGIRAKLIDYRQVNSAKSNLVLEYKHIADEDKSIEYQIIECHYGYAVGQAEALKRIFKAAA
jgi:hypothetical protein